MPPTDRLPIDEFNDDGLPLVNLDPAFAPLPDVRRAPAGEMPAQPPLQLNQGRLPARGEPYYRRQIDPAMAATRPTDTQGDVRVPPMAIEPLSPEELADRQRQPTQPTPTTSNPLVGAAAAALRGGANLIQGMANIGGGSVRSRASGALGGMSELMAPFVGPRESGRLMNEANRVQGNRFDMDRVLQPGHALDRPWVGPKPGETTDPAILAANYIGGQLQRASDSLGYRPTVDPQTVAEMYRRGDWLGIARNTPAFAAEMFLQSWPEWAAAGVSPLLPLAMIAQNIGEERGKNGSAVGAQGNTLAAIPFATAAALLERFGVQGLIRTAGRNAATRIIRAAAREGATEYPQEIAEYIGENQGLGEGPTTQGAMERGFLGALGGAGAGAGIRGAAEVANAPVTPLNRRASAALGALRQTLEQAQSPDSPVPVEQREAAVAEAVGAVARQFGLRDTRAEAYQGKPGGVEAAYRPDDDLIRISMQINQGVAPSRVFHEIVHAVEGRLSDRDRSVLRNAADQWLDSKIDEGQLRPGAAPREGERTNRDYLTRLNAASLEGATPDEQQRTLRSEAISHLGEMFLAQQQAPQRAWQYAVNRMVDATRALGDGVLQVFGQDGRFRTADDIYRAITTGSAQLGARVAGPQLASQQEGRLDPSLEARQQRAAEQGYGPTVFHGTSADANFRGFKAKDRGVWTTESPMVAGEYAQNNDSQRLRYAPGGKFERVNDSPRVIPVRSRAQNVYAPTDDELRALAQAPNYQRAQAAFFRDIKARGFDAVDMRGGIRVDLDPSNLRAAHAMFDPAKQGKNDLLASTEEDQGWANTPASMSDPTASSTSASGSRTSEAPSATAATGSSPAKATTASPTSSSATPGQGASSPTTGSPASSPWRLNQKIDAGGGLMVNVYGDVDPAWAQRVIDAVPKFGNERVLQFLAASGTTINVGHSYEQQFPNSAGNQPRGWPAGSTMANTHGHYQPWDQQVWLFQYFRSRRNIIIDGLTGARRERLVEYDDQYDTTRHELGHALDRAINSLRDIEAIRAAWKLDTSRMSEETKRHFDYYTINDSESAAISESIAELLGGWFGDYRSSLAYDMPNVKRAIQHRVRDRLLGSERPKISVRAWTSDLQRDLDDVNQRAIKVGIEREDIRARVMERAKKAGVEGVSPANWEEHATPAEKARYAAKGRSQSKIWKLYDKVYDKLTGAQASVASQLSALDRKYAPSPDIKVDDFVRDDKESYKTKGEIYDVYTHKTLPLYVSRTEIPPGVDQWNPDGSVNWLGSDNGGRTEFYGDSLERVVADMADYAQTDKGREALGFTMQGKPFLASVEELPLVSVPAGERIGGRDIRNRRENAAAYIQALAEAYPEGIHNEALGQPIRFGSQAKRKIPNHAGDRIIDALPALAEAIRVAVPTMPSVEGRRSDPDTRMLHNLGARFDFGSGDVEPFRFQVKDKASGGSWLYDFGRVSGATPAAGARTPQGGSLTAMEGEAAPANDVERQLPADKVAKQAGNHQQAPDTTRAEGEYLASMSEDAPPQNTVKAYKLFRRGRDGQLYPLFIGARKPVPTGRWVAAEHIPTKGFAERPGWHAGVLPTAPHLRTKAGRRAADRVWAEVEMPADKDWQAEADASRTRDIRDRVPEGGFYRFKTNKMQGGAWMIGGALKVNRILTPDELRDVLRQAGQSDEEIEAEAAPATELASVEEARQVSKADQLIADIRKTGFVPNSAVRAIMGDYPGYLDGVAEYMTRQRARTVAGQLAPRDVAKAWYITVASQGAGAISPAIIERKTGFRVPSMFLDQGGLARPEEAAAAWLGSPMGQRALAAIDRGEVDDEAWQDGFSIRRAYGDDRFSTIRADKALPTLAGITNAVNAAKGDVGKVEKAALQLNGIGAGKIGFIKQMLGFGDTPTLDAVEINTWLTGRGDIATLDGKRADLARRVKEHASSKKVSEFLRDRIAQRFNSLRREVPEAQKIAPGVYQHIMHHWLWDRAKGVETTHQGMYHAMEYFSVEEDGKKVYYVPPTAGEAAALIGNVPLVDPQMLVGKKVFPILADLTDTGRMFVGIDSSAIDPIELPGGPRFPLLLAMINAKLAWAVRGGARATSKVMKNADYAVVIAMAPDTHGSNATVMEVTLRTMDAYVRDGRISPDNLKRIENAIRQRGKTAKEAEVRPLRDFPGYNNAEAAKDWLHNATFRAREAVVEALARKGKPGQDDGPQQWGAPNIDRILRNTIDPNYAGYNQRDAILLLKIKRGKNGVVSFADVGLPNHPSYPLGIRGEVVGRFPAPVASEVLFKPFFDQRRKASKATKGDMRSQELALPVVTVTPAMADKMRAQPYERIVSPRQAQLTLDWLEGNWKTSDTKKKEGGVSPAEFVDAIRSSDAAATLTPYQLRDLNGQIRKGGMRVFQLGDGQIFFALKKANYTAEYQIPGMENETAIVGVVNNEIGAKGVAGPAVMLKALAEGATALDCYAVPSKRNPNGFLPELYASFGFEPVGEPRPFDETFIEDKNKLRDLYKFWHDTGWDQSMGRPPLVIMRWKGDDRDRQQLVQRYLAAGEVGIGRGAAPGDASAAAEHIFAPSGSGSRNGGRRGRSDAGSRAGAVRRDAGGLPHGVRGVARELGQLGPSDLENLKIDPTRVQRLRDRGLLAEGGVIDLRHGGVVPGYAEGGVPRQHEPLVRLEQMGDDLFINGGGQGMRAGPARITAGGGSLGGSLDVGEGRLGAAVTGHSTHVRTPGRSAHDTRPDGGAVFYRTPGGDAYSLEAFRRAGPGGGMGQERGAILRFQRQFADGGMVPPAGPAAAGLGAAQGLPAGMGAPMPAQPPQAPPSGFLPPAMASAPLPQPPPFGGPAQSQHADMLASPPAGQLPITPTSPAQTLAERHGYTAGLGATDPAVRGAVQALELWHAAKQVAGRG